MAGAATLAALCLGGCGTGGVSPSALTLPAVKVAMPDVKMPEVKMPDVKMPDVKMPKLEMPKMVGPAVGTPTEVYTRVARGALLCWFGGNGPLKGKYIYHADAEPPSRGGKAEIAVHAIDTSSPTPRAGRVFHITITPEGERALMTAENLRLPDELARQMWYDAHRWAATTDDVACSDGDTAEGWNAGATTAATSAKPTPPARKPAASAAAKPM